MCYVRVSTSEQLHESVVLTADTAHTIQRRIPLT